MPKIRAAQVGHSSVAGTLLLTVKWDSFAVRSAALLLGSLPQRYRHFWTASEAAWQLQLTIDLIDSTPVIRGEHCRVLGTSWFAILPSMATLHNIT